MFRNEKMTNSTNHDNGVPSMVSFIKEEEYILEEDDIKPNDIKIHPSFYTAYNTQPTTGPISTDAEASTVKNNSHNKKRTFINGFLKKSAQTSFNGIDNVTIPQPSATPVLQGYNLYKCGYDNCTNSLSTEDKFRHHIQICQMSGIKGTLHCPHCKNRFDDRTNFIDHIKTHGPQHSLNPKKTSTPTRISSNTQLRGKDLYKCGCRNCTYASTTEDLLKEHLIICDDSRNSPLLRCPHCKFICSTDVRYLEHLRQHGPMRYFCGVENCSYKDLTEWALKKHMSLIHNYTSTKSILIDNAFNKNPETQIFIVCNVDNEASFKKLSANASVSLNQQNHSKTNSLKTQANIVKSQKTDHHVQNLFTKSKPLKEIPNDLLNSENNKSKKRIISSDECNKNKCIKRTQSNEVPNILIKTNKTLVNVVANNNVKVIPSKIPEKSNEKLSKSVMINDTPQNETVKDLTKTTKSKPNCEPTEISKSQSNSSINSDLKIKMPIHKSSPTLSVKKSSPRPRTEIEVKERDVRQEFKKTNHGSQTKKLPISSNSQPEIDPIVLDDIPIKQKFKCIQCNFTSEIDFVFFNHLDSHTFLIEMKESPTKVKSNNKETVERINIGDFELFDNENDIPSEIRCPDLYTCAHCNHVSSNAKLFRIHQVEKHNNADNIKCLHCPMILPKEKYCNHVELHGNQLYRCGWCSGIATQPSTIEDHCKKIHPFNSVLLFVVRGSLNQDLWKCDLCQYTSVTINEVQDHISEIHNTKSQYKCYYCGYNRSDMNLLKDHVSNKHPTKSFQVICNYHLSSKNILDNDIDKNSPVIHMKTKNLHKDASSNSINNKLEGNVKNSPVTKRKNESEIKSTKIKQEVQDTAEDPLISKNKSNDTANIGNSRGMIASVPINLGRETSSNPVLQTPASQQFGHSDISFTIKREVVEEITEGISSCLLICCHCGHNSNRKKMEEHMKVNHKDQPFILTHHKTVEGKNIMSIEHYHYKCDYCEDSAVSLMKAMNHWADMHVTSDFKFTIILKKTIDNFID